MAIETLLTPHPLKLAGGHQQRPLVEHVDPGAIADFLPTVSELGPDMHEAVLVDAVDYICRETRRALWYPKLPVKIGGQTVKRTFYPNLEQLDSIQVADCYGFTIVASELMEQARIPHFVSYINGHAATMVPINEGCIRYADPLSPELNHDATDNLDINALLQFMNNSQSNLALHLNTFKMSETLGMSWAHMFEKYPWVSVRQNPKLPYPRKNECLPVARIFKPDDGRKALSGHATFLRAFYDERFDDAFESLTSLGDLYPEVDLRQRHTEIRTLARNLAAQGRTEIARLCVDTYLSGIRSVAHDPRIDILRGDCLRTIAANSNDGGSAIDAIAAYSIAEIMAQHGQDIIASKMQKASSLANRVCAETLEC